jgi:4-hydroxy-3-methylbut-2-en-1-yl diphosphate synthase IspG/GcpE
MQYKNKQCESGYKHVAMGDDGIFSTQARIAFHHSVTETGMVVRSGVMMSRVGIGEALSTL